jgi:hypothetical protein
MATVGGLAWERTYRLNDKYVYPKDDSGVSGCVDYDQFYFPYWDYKRWASWLKGEVHETAALLQEKGSNP